MKIHEDAIARFLAANDFHVGVEDILSYRHLLARKRHIMIAALLLLLVMVAKIYSIITPPNSPAAIPFIDGVPNMYILSTTILLGFMHVSTSCSLTQYPNRWKIAAINQDLDIAAKLFNTIFDPHASVSQDEYTRSKNVVEVITKKMLIVEAIRAVGGRSRQLRFEEEAQLAFRVAMKFCVIKGYNCLFHSMLERKHTLSAIKSQDPSRWKRFLDIQ